MSVSTYIIKQGICAAPAPWRSPGRLFTGRKRPQDRGSTPWADHGSTKALAAGNSAAGRARRTRSTHDRPAAEAYASNTMPCFHPIPAWKDHHGNVSLKTRRYADELEKLQDHHDRRYLQLPCGTCIGCRMAAARAWSLRCSLEQHQHAQSVFTTLTYSDENLPPTLNRRDLQLFLKRLRRSRATRTIRFFGCGEYGSQTARPHYHAILYGIAQTARHEIEDAWRLGHTRTEPLNQARISYTAGYTVKKLVDAFWAKEHEYIDHATGEVITWQPPFLQMSRNPGIGADAKYFTNSWRLNAYYQGRNIPVPRFLHEAWKQTATPEQIISLENEKHEISLQRDTNKERLAAMEIIARKQQELKDQRRRTA